MTNSMQCPKCDQPVAIADEAGGSRVRCPHCKHEFVVPGFVASNSDDDDWLNLDDPLPLSSGDPGLDDPVTLGGSGGASGDVASGEMPSGLGQSEDDDLFSDDLPDLESSFPGSEASAANLPDGGPAVPSTPLSQQANTKPAKSPSAGKQPDAAARAESAKGDASGRAVATSVDLESEYAVRCKLCGSILYAKAERAGKKVKCPDCHSELVIPPPPKKKQKHKFDPATAESFSFSEQKSSARPEDPFRKSAAELLDAASREEEETPKSSYDFETPKVREWAATVFGIFKQPGVLFHWLVLSAVASLVSAAVLSTGMFFLVLMLFPLGLIFAGVVVGCGFAILQSVANDEDAVTEWPVFADPVEWLATLGVSVAAAVLSAVPALALSQMVFHEQPLVVVFITMISIYALYPFVLLSMLDMQSILTPFSPEVAKSVTRCEESWGGYYFSSGLLFVFLYLIIVASSLMAPPVAAVVNIFAAVGAAFLYFAMLGRLAFQIGQSVNDEPRDNDIEQIRRAERESTAS